MFGAFLFLFSFAALFVPANLYAQGKGSEAEQAAPHSETQSSDHTLANPDAAKPSTEKNVPEASQKDGQGLFGPVRVGPSVALAIPHPLNYGIDLIAFKRVGFGASFGSLPSVKIQEANIDLSYWQLGVRVFPFSGSFFLGLNYGNQKISGDVTQDVTTIVQGVSVTAPVKAKLSVKSTTLTPHLGWMWLADSGLMWGTELGYQMALSHDSTFDADVESSNLTAEQKALLKGTSDYQDVKKKAEDAGKKIGEQGLPYWTIIRLGWLF